MSAHIQVARAAISSAIPYVIPTIANRLARQAAPIAVKEINHWAKRAGLDYRIVSTISKHRRKLAKIREENMYYSPEELHYLRQKRQNDRSHFQTARQMLSTVGAGKESNPPVIGPPTIQQATRATAFPGTVYRQFEGQPVTKEMYEILRTRATRARGRQYPSSNAQAMPGPPPSFAPSGREPTIGSSGVEDEGHEIVEDEPAGEIIRGPVEVNPHEFISDQFEFGPPPPLPPIGPVEPSPSPYLSLPAPPPDPLPKLLREATIQPKSYTQKYKHTSLSKKKKTPRKGYEHYTGYTESEAKALANLMGKNTAFLSIKKRAQLGEADSSKLIQELTPSAAAEIPMMSSSLIRKKPRSA